MLQARLAQFHYDSQFEKVSDQETLALLQRLAGDAAGAKITAEQARNTLEPHTKINQTMNPYPRYLPLAYALMGEKNSALNEAERAIMLLPRAKEPLIGPTSKRTWRSFRRCSARIAERSQPSRAYYKRPMSGFLYCPTPVTPALLRLDPIWDPLRADPAFQKLCEEKQP